MITDILIFTLFVFVFMLILGLGHTNVLIQKQQSQIDSMSKQLTSVSDFTLKLYSSAETNSKNISAVMQYIHDNGVTVTKQNLH